MKMENQDQNTQPQLKTFCLFNIKSYTVQHIKTFTMAKKIKEIIINIGRYIIGYACLLILLPFILAFVNEIGEREKRGIPVFLGFPDDDVFFQDEENRRKYAEAMEKMKQERGDFSF